MVTRFGALKNTEMKAIETSNKKNKHEMQMAYCLKQPPTNTITIRTKAQTQNRKQHSFPHTFVAATRFGALTVQESNREIV